MTRQQLASRIFFCLMLVAVLVFTTGAFAQAAPAPAPGQQGRGGRAQMTPEARLEHLTQTLTLTDAQKAKIKPILEDETKQMQALRADTTTPQEQRREKMMGIRTKSNDQIKAVLNPDQVKKFEEMMKAGPRGGQRPPAPPTQ